MFEYADFETVNAEGKRFYCLPDNIFYPSITTVLGGTMEVEKSASLEAWRNRIGHAQAVQVTRNAADRGTSLHSMLERQLKGLDPETHKHGAEAVRMFNSLRLHLKHINTVLGQEVVLYSHGLEVAGRCDLVCEYDGAPAIVDYKSSTRAKSESDIGDYFLQAAFYAMAHNEMFGTDIKRLVIMMGVTNGLPRVFKKTLDDELMLKLIDRVQQFHAQARL